MDPTSYEELSEEFRQSTKLVPHQVRKDLYKAMANFVLDSEKALDQAIEQHSSELIMEGLRDRFRSNVRLVDMVVDARIRYVERLAVDQVKDWEITDEERVLLDNFGKLRDDFRKEVTLL